MPTLPLYTPPFIYSYRRASRRYAFTPPAAAATALLPLAD